MYFVYILSNQYNTVLYTGMTNDLKRRIYEHKNNLVKGFTQKYCVHKLVYYEWTENVESAIEREKQIKAGSRSKKLALIETYNPNWLDLWDEIV